MEYEIALSPNLLGGYPVFHILMVRRYVPNGSHRLQHEDLGIRPDLSYEVEAVRILDPSTKTLCWKGVPLVKVLWSRKGVEEATWERKE